MVEMFHACRASFFSLPLSYYSYTLIHPRLVSDSVARDMGWSRHSHERARTSSRSRSTLWAGKHIYFHTDNMSQAARTPALTHLMRFYAAYYRFHFSVKHILGLQNTAANALSRNHLPLFFSLVPPQIQQFNVTSAILQLSGWTGGRWTGPNCSQTY